MAYTRMLGKKTPSKPKTMTVLLDLSDSDPTTWATYADDAVGMEAGSDDWDTFFGHYPCILDNGTELGKLKRSNFAQYEDGTSAPITTLGKDVMICFPRRGIKIEYLDANRLSVSMTDEDNKTGYSYMAHSYKGNACDKFYLGVYKGYGSSNKLYSISGQTPTVSQTIGTFRTWAQARGTGYEQSAYYQLLFRQVMYCLKYACQNAQIVIGKGYTYNTSVSWQNDGRYGNTGYTNDKGMDWGEDTGLLPMKLFGLEDFYGNINEAIDGIMTNANRQYYATDGNYNNSGSDYECIISQTSNANLDHYLYHPIGGNKTGFLRNSTATNSGSVSTYFCDATALYDGRFGRFGGFWNSTVTAGVFYMQLATTSSDSGYILGSRLMYMHTAA